MSAETTGRDWRGEIVAVERAHDITEDLTCRCGWEPSDGCSADEYAGEYYAHKAQAFVAALGLHDLEQAAAKWKAIAEFNQHERNELKVLWDAAREQVRVEQAANQRLREAVQQVAEKLDEHLARMAEHQQTCVAAIDARDSLSALAAEPSEGNGTS